MHKDMPSEKKRKYVKTKIAFGVIVVLAGIVFSISLFQGYAWKKNVIQQIADADCIVIDTNVIPWTSKSRNEMPLLPTVRVEGREKVQEFIDAIKIKNSFIRGHCMCLGELAFRFYQGDKVLLSVTYHHGSSLRQGHNLSDLNMTLTSASISAINNWLERYGGQQLEEARQEKSRLMDEWRESKMTASQPASNPAQ